MNARPTLKRPAIVPFTEGRFKSNRTTKVTDNGKCDAEKRLLSAQNARSRQIFVRFSEPHQRYVFQELKEI
jgi:hypothetical protein